MAKKRRKKTKKFLKKFFILVLILLITLMVTFFFDKKSFNKLTNNIMLEINKITSKIENTIKKYIKEKYDNIDLSDELTVMYLDVGQAESVLIKSQDEYMLIDAGNNKDGEKIVKYFKYLGITDFKYVFGTHAHEDHIGGMDDVILNFNIEHFYMSDVITTTKTFEDVLDALEEKQVKFETPKIDDEFSLGDANIKVIYVGNDSENLNNSSIVLKLTYKNIRFLFTGDAESSVEKTILDKDIQADILKVGHHGSSTSSSEKFIKNVSPSYAIISVGKDNSYKHPNKKTLNTLDKYNVKVLRTDELGTIIFTSDGTQFNYTNINTNIDGDK